MFSFGCTATSNTQYKLEFIYIQQVNVKLMLFQSKAIERCRGHTALISLCMSRIKITLEMSGISLKTRSNSTDTGSFCSSLLGRHFSYCSWMLTDIWAKPPYYEVSLWFYFNKYLRIWSFVESWFASGFASCENGAVTAANMFWTPSHKRMINFRYSDDWDQGQSVLSNSRIIRVCQYEIWP